MNRKLSKKLLSALLAAVLILTSAPVSAFAATDTALQRAQQSMEAYEAKMDGTVYTEMLGAYNAYVTLNEAVDNYLYGLEKKASYGTLITAAGILDDKVSLMEPVASKPVYSAEEIGYAPNVSYNAQTQVMGSYFDNTDASSGILYSSKTIDNSGETRPGGRNVWYSVNTSSLIVLLYDGITVPGYPMLLTNRSYYLSIGGAQTYVWNSAYCPDSQPFAPEDIWKGSENNLGGWVGYPVSDGSYEYSVSNKSDGASGVELSHKTGRVIPNKIVYTGTGNTDNYYDLVNPTLTFNINGNYADKGNSASVYVINYKGMMDLYNNALTVFSGLGDISSYKEGGARDIMEYFQYALTDPNSYFPENGANDVTAAENAVKLAGDIKNAVTDYDRVITDTASYQALRDTLNSVNSYGDTPLTISTSGIGQNGSEYNSILFREFASCLTPVREVFNNVYSAGYDFEADFTDINNALINAFNALKQNKSVDVESAGDIITVSNNIFTHGASGYNYYGQEVSDNPDYNANESEQSGERVTYINVKYPYDLDLSNGAVIYCVTNDSLDTDKYTPNEFIPLDIYGNELNGSIINPWINSDGTVLSDSEAQQAYENGEDVYKKYILSGNVSNYFSYDSEKDSYQEGTIVLLINYYNAVVEEKNSDGTVRTYGEYEFPYVTANPSIAHEIVGIRNQKEPTSWSGANCKIAIVDFSRFSGSEGSATSVRSDLTYDTDRFATGSNSDLPDLCGNGIFSYLESFGDEASTGDSVYASPAGTAALFKLMDKSDGVNSGSYAMLEHTNEEQITFTNTPNVVNVDYYIDYSDKTNGLINYDSNGVPYGYKFNLEVSNLYWNPDTSNTTLVGGTSYYKATGDLADLDITYSDSCTDTANGTLSTSSTIKHKNTSYANKLFVDYTSSLDGLGSEYINSSSYGSISEFMGSKSSDSKVAFENVQKAYNKNNTWNGVVTFTGNSTVSKNSYSDVAEDYANYVLQIGNVNERLGMTAKYYHTEDVYMYYNLGVAVCDKGAIRNFLETYANKDLVTDENGKVVRDEATGLPTIDTSNSLTGDIKSSLYSVSTYQDYLRKLGHIYQFTGNYKDTTVQSDNPETNGTDNVTAYDSSGNPIIKSGVEGMNILEDEIVTTDEEQIQLIEDVISAYENLLQLSDFDDYKQKAAETLTEIENSGLEVTTSTDSETGKITVTVNGEYTQPSLDALSNALTVANEYYQYYPDRNNPVENQSYWRNTPLNNDEYQLLQDIVDSAVEALMPVIDYDELNTLARAKAGHNTSPIEDATCAGGIYDSNDNQVYTVNSWMDLYYKLIETQSIFDNCFDENHNRVGMYAYDGNTTSYDFMGTNFTFTGHSESEANYSDEQIAVYNDLPKLRAVNLKPVDKADTYANFDAVVEAINAMDRDKYNDEGLLLLDALIKQLNNGEISSLLTDPQIQNKMVYQKVDTAFSNAYYHGTNRLVPIGTLLKATTYDDATGSETDLLTAYLLTFINTLNTNYVNEYEAYLIVQDTDGNVIKNYAQADGVYVADAKKSYGEMFEITDSASLSGENAVTWSATLYSKGDASKAVNGDTTVNPVASQKVSSYYGSTLMRKADCDVVITATVAKDASLSGGNIVYVYNAYNNISDIKYYNGEELTAENVEEKLGISNAALPFYTFTGWTVSYDNDGVTVRVRPVFSADKYVTVTVPQNTKVTAETVKATASTDTSKLARFSSGIKITAPNDDFYAWATVSQGESRYRIVSYSKSYEFAAFENEEYFVVTKGEDGNYYIGSTMLTGDNVLGVGNRSVTGVTDNQYLNSKLDKKAPFIYLQTVNTYTDAGSYKLRGYFRITQGNEDLIQGYGITFVRNGVEYNKNINAKSEESGQYTVTFSSSSQLNIDSLPMCGFVIYSYDYTFTADDGTEINQTINTYDDSLWTAEPPATVSVDE